MDTVNIGLIRVLTLTDQNKIDRHGSIIENAFPGLTVTSGCIRNQPQGLHDKASEEAAKPKIISLAKELAKGVDAIIVSCAADPAVAELKGMLNIPVLGAGESLAAVSRVVGDCAGVLTITDDVPSPVSTGLQGRCLAWAKVAGVKTTLDLEGEGIVARAVDAANDLKNRGSDVIALACTGFSTIGVASMIGREVGIPVIDPVLAVGSMAYFLMMHREGRERAKD